MYCTGVAHFVNNNAWMTFLTHSWPATGNSKPDSPYQPACLRSVTLGLWSVRLCSASASWCWINGWNVRPKLNLCWLQRNVHSKDFIYSFEHDIAHAFWWPRNNEDGNTSSCCACMQSKTPEQPSSYKASSRQSSYKLIINWYVGMI